MRKLKAPFPWFGGKSRAARMVWERFGDVGNYVEPFAGSLAVLLGRPTPAKVETVNDLDCYLANFWRATQRDPEAVARWADAPVNEADLHARHRWLHRQADFRERMRNDPEYFDSRIAGWWVWGLSCWIGDNWCRPREQNAAPHLQSASKGVHQLNANLLAWFAELSARLRRVRVCCGDWSRVLKPSVTVGHGVTGVLLDPPYGVEDRDTVYNHDSLALASAVRAWCAEHGSDARLRIALCGYDGEHNELEALGWNKVAWKAMGGYGNQNGTKNDNARRERIWFSPHCLRAGLFDG